MSVGIFEDADGKSSWGRVCGFMAVVVCLLIDIAYSLGTWRAGHIQIPNPADFLAEGGFAGTIYGISKVNDTIRAFSKPTAPGETVKSTTETVTVKPP